MQMGQKKRSSCVLSDVCQISQGQANLAVHEQVGLGVLSIVSVIHRRTSYSPRRLIWAGAVAGKGCGSGQVNGEQSPKFQVQPCVTAAGLVNWSLRNCVLLYMDPHSLFFELCVLLGSGGV